MLPAATPSAATPTEGARPDAPPPARRGRLCGALCAAALAGACATTDLGPAYSAHEAGRFPAAAEAALRIEPDRDGDTIWVLLERGKILQDAGRWEESAAALARADELFETLEEAAVISAGAIGDTATALVTDDRSLDYVGTGTDRILLGVAMVVNHLMLGDADLAAVYARRQLNRQREAQELHAKQIEALAERERASREEGAQVSLEDVQGQEGFREQSARLESYTNPGYAAFSVPYGYYVSAIALGAASQFGEQARMLEDLAGMVPDAEPVRELLGQQGLGGRVFVLFENGLAPARIDRSFWYVSPLGATSVPIPDLVVRDQGRNRALRVSAGGESRQTVRLDVVDGMIASEFKAALPGIWLRAVVAVVLKEVATKQVQDEIGGWGVLLGSLVKVAVKPDTRTWRSLPGEHQVAHLPRPASGVVSLSLVGGAGAGGPPLEVELPGQGACLLWVRTTAPGGMAVYPVSLERDAGIGHSGWSTNVDAGVDSGAR